MVASKILYIKLVSKAPDKPKHADLVRLSFFPVAQKTAYFTKPAFEALKLKDKYENSH